MSVTVEMIVPEPGRVSETGETALEDEGGAEEGSIPVL